MSTPSSFPSSSSVAVSCSTYGIPASKVCARPSHIPSLLIVRSHPSRLLHPQIKLGLCQMLVSDDKATNIQVAREAVERAAKEGAQIISLPGAS